MAACFHHFPPPTQTPDASDESDVSVLVGTSLMSEDANALIPIALVNDHHFWALAPAQEQPAASLTFDLERFEGNPLKMSVSDGPDLLDDEDAQPVWTPLLTCGCARCFD